MKVPPPTLAPILRSDAQGRILARVLTDPESSYSLSDLVAWSRTSMPTVQREIDRAEQAGIVTTEKVGPTRLVRANVAHPPHDAVRRIILATYGPPAVIAEEFQAIAGADAVLLFGSWAARYLGEPGRAPIGTRSMTPPNARNAALAFQCKPRCARARSGTRSARASSRRSERGHWWSSLSPTTRSSHLKRPTSPLHR